MTGDGGRCTCLEGIVTSRSRGTHSLTVPTLDSTVPLDIIADVPRKTLVTSCASQGTNRLVVSVGICSGSGIGTGRSECWILLRLTRPVVNDETKKYTVGAKFIE